MMGEDEVLATELELELVVESASDLDLSRFDFCRNFGSLEDECGVDGAGEEFDGEWRDLLEVIVPRSGYVLTPLNSSFSPVRVQNNKGVCLHSQALQILP
jgi:hypothetical protein